MKRTGGGDAESRAGKDECAGEPRAAKGADLPKKGKEKKKKHDCAAIAQVKAGTESGEK